MSFNKEWLKEKIQNIIQLPALPDHAVEIINMVEDPNVTASALGKVVSKDQVLTAKVLKIANSPFYGFSKRIATIDFAIIVLGFDTLKEVVMSISFISSLNKKLTKGFNSIQFWNHSISCGVISRALARNYGYRVIGEVFIAGLLHDIGILIVNQYFNKQYKEIVKLINDEELTLIEAEKSIFDVTHAEIGSWLAEKWNFPEQLVESIAYHHNPSNSSNFKEIVSIIHKADFLCQKYKIGNFDLEENLVMFTDSDGELLYQDIDMSEEFIINFKQVILDEIEQSRNFFTIMGALSGN
jgi:putative nucleotidyltransferase with HDIG domain